MHIPGRAERVFHRFLIHSAAALFSALATQSAAQLVPADCVLMHLQISNGNLAVVDFAPNY